MRLYQQFRWSAKILLLATPALVIAATSEQKFDDWIVSNTCSQNTNRLCKGYYKQPIFAELHGQNPADLPITITSDEGSFVSKGTSVFNGNVIAVQGDKIIYADKAEVVHNPGTGTLETITAIGNVKIMQPGLRVDGDKAIAYVATDRKVIENAVYRVYSRHARGNADTLVVNGNNKMDLEPATYTTCAPGSDAWRLQASETNFNKDTGRGQAWHARMYMQNIPVFYWPYVNFPIDKRRQTGFLQPDFQSSSTNGKTLILPFYWNMAPNYDGTIRTNYMTKRGFKFDTLWRYLTASSNGSINFDFLPNDRTYRVLREDALADPGFIASTKRDDVLRRLDLKNYNRRYRYTWKHSSQISSKLLFTVDYTNASDGNYLNDFITNWNYASPQASNIYALQTAGLQYSDFFGSLKANMEEYKSFHAVNGPASSSQQLRKIPEFNFSSATFNLPYNFNWLINAIATNFKPRLINGDPNIYNYGQRLYMRPALMYSLMEPGWFIQPRVQLNQVRYANLRPGVTIEGTLQHATIKTIPLYDIKTGLIFERPLEIKNTNLLQTLEPTVYYLYVPDQDQSYLPSFDTGINTFDYNQVFRDNSYSGYDRVAQANQIGLGLATKFFNELTGDEIAMFGVGQIRYLSPNIVPVFETNNLDKHWSPIALVGKVRIAPKYTVEANLVRDKTSTKTASLQLYYRQSPTRIFNFGYQLNRNPALDDLNGVNLSDIKQVVASAAWQITPPMRLLGKAGYDLQFHHATNILAGLEYHSCCTAIRFIWTKDWQQNLSNRQGQYVYSVGLRIIFKGFAGVGSVEDSYLAQAIPGYTAQD